MECQSESNDSSIDRRFFYLKTLTYILGFLLLNHCSLFAQQDSTLSNKEIIESRANAAIKYLIENNQTNNKEAENTFEDIEIDQMMVNSMISKAGDDFFDAFTSDFEWPKTEQNFIIIVTERPFIASATLVTIKVNDLEVFQNILQPRNSFLEELADYAQAVTLRYIINYQQIMNDLDGQDRSGSGIY